MIRLPSGRRIGTGETPFIIAEVGSNFRTIDDCKKSLAFAKATGADAVKFQLYTAEDLYGRPHPGDGSQDWSEHVRWLGFQETCLPRDWIPILADKARAVGIEFMCSAFSADGYRFLEPHVSLHKVATAENSHAGILKELSRQGKPTLVSQGPASLSELAHAREILGPATMIPLYCVADYPARRVRLETITEMRTHFGAVGYSDHTTDVLEIPARAVKLGACVLEKHVNFADVTGTPDAPHSLSTEEFRDMVDRVRSGVGKPAAQAAMVSTHRRRLIATRAIQAGEPLQVGVNYGAYRALAPMPEALSAFALFDVDGLFAKHDVAAGGPIAPGTVYG